MTIEATEEERDWWWAAFFDWCSFALLTLAFVLLGLTLPLQIIRWLRKALA